MVDSNKKMVKRDADRIGDLPDSILHHILSFLDMKEVVETSILSTRWRNLWVSVPVLNFNHSLWEKKSKIKKNNRLLKSKFMNFVDKVLFHHDGSNVTKFDISCSSFCDLDRFGGWMTLAARKQIQEMHIDLKAYKAGEFESRELPGAIFCSAITVFKFDLKTLLFKEYNGIQMPNSISLSPQLKTLVLKFVKLPQGNSNGELVLSCPVLENLELVACEMEHLNVLNISTLQLRNMVFENFNSEKLESCQIKIFTPILESLKLRGLSYNNYSLGSLSSLVNVTIVSYGTSAKAQYFIQLLESISCATRVELSGGFQDPTHDISDMLTVSFSNLRCLKLGEGCIRSTNTIFKLFKSSPCIETLVLNEYKMKNWREDLYHFNFDHLKSLVIGRFNGYKYEINFLEFLLENAVALEKLTIKMGYFKGKFVERMYSLVKASSGKVALSVQ